MFLTFKGLSNRALQIFMSFELQIEFDRTDFADYRKIKKGKDT